LPNAGKSTLFNALTKAGASVAEYPFTTIDPNRGVVRVPDERLQKIASKVEPKEIVPATIEFIDIAGLIRGSSKGEGLGNQFLAHIRDVDSIVMVVRCFDDPNIPHIYGTIDPRRDIEIINLELCLADLVVLERRIQKTKRAIAYGQKGRDEELEFLLRLRIHLNDGVPARLMSLKEPEEGEILRQLNLLTSKPVLYAANVSEQDLENGRSNASQEIDEFAHSENSETVIISAKLESELTELPSEEAQAYLSILGLREPRLIQLIRASYTLLDLVTFFTFGEYGLKAWSVPRSTSAPQAAGKVHADMERGFIRLEVISCEEFLQIGSVEAARKKGLIRLEGKDYTIQDGDIIYVRFNV